MIDLSTPNEWQHIDPETGLLFPWYTKSFLDELATWDLKEKELFEFGGGASTLWFVSKGCKCYGIDTNEAYVEAVYKALVQGKWNGIYYHADNKELYIGHIKERCRVFDIIIIDGDPVEWRDDCVKPALDCIKPGGTLIIDNWDQPSVWVPSDETRALIAPYEMKVYKQEGHPDWQTATFKII